MKSNLKTWYLISNMGFKLSRARFKTTFTTRLEHESTTVSIVCLQVLKPQEQTVMMVYILMIKILTR